MSLDGVNLDSDAPLVPEDPPTPNARAIFLRALANRLYWLTEGERGTLRDIADRLTTLEAEAARIRELLPARNMLDTLAQFVLDVAQDDKLFTVEIGQPDARDGTVGDIIRSRIRTKLATFFMEK
jgi:LmbE family N-acetylglucosaminyl deacetylase